jgi:hypothetical protein
MLLTYLHFCIPTDYSLYVKKNSRCYQAIFKGALWVYGEKIFESRIFFLIFLFSLFIFFEKMFLQLKSCQNTWQKQSYLIALALVLFGQVILYRGGNIGPVTVRFIPVHFWGRFTSGYSTRLPGYDL